MIARSPSGRASARRYSTTPPDRARDQASLTRRARTGRPARSSCSSKSISATNASVLSGFESKYRSPADVPEGVVLVVGGGNTGYQIAEELAAGSGTPRARRLTLVRRGSGCRSGCDPDVGTGG